MSIASDYTKNEVVAKSHRDQAYAFRAIAKHFERWRDDYTLQEVIQFLNEVADEADAQAIVVELRDEL